MGAGEPGMGRQAGRIITELWTFGRRPDSNSALDLTLSSASHELMDSVTKKFKASSRRCSAGLVGPTWLPQCGLSKQGSLALPSCPYHRVEGGIPSSGVNTVPSRPCRKGFSTFAGGGLKSGQ